MALNTPTASASLPTSAESSAAPRWKYDVFLSFRHEDTGRGFTSYLYNELQKREIKTFMDNDEMILDRGEGISQVILEAIQESRFAIVVLSENYASSSWCLDELTQIIQCMDFKETVVLPVFYHLDPSDVRHQRGAYGHAFVEHEQRFGDQTERLRKWKDALLTVSDIFGWSKNDYESERQFVKQIVEFICSRPIESETRQATDEISPRWKHDVFINFRGMDTRNGFLSHLHDELQNTENLNIARDDGPDAKGQLIVPYLLKAIEESRFALVVLSPNFAGSSWCLEELAKIFECMGGQKRILPIFYKVDPSDVRRQTGSFGEGLARFEDRFERDKVLKWRRVLTMVANLSGFDSSNYGYEGELIRHVAEECSRRVTELTGDFETTGDVRSMASPQPEPAPVKNDVLSGFGIEDTRRGFVAHSDHELQNTGVNRTFREHETQNTDENHVEEEIVIPSTSPPSPAVGDPENGVALPSTSPVIGQQNDEFLNTREEDNHRGFVTHLGHETQNTDANHVEDEIAVPSTSPPSLAVGDPENGVALPSTSPVIGQQNDEFLNTRGEDNHRGFVTHLGHETQNTDENHLEEEIAVPSTSPSSPAVGDPRVKYDVFLSFRGEDTRKGFIAYLYRELQKTRAIKTFKDDVQLKKGTVIASNLLRAIEESRFAIIVFSEKYADSAWCLDELTKIFECMEGKDTILPIFYKLDPAVVRYQKKETSFGEAFVKHEARHDIEKTNQWRAALKGVAGISGWDLNRFPTELELIDDIVEHLLEKVLQAPNRTFGTFEATRQAMDEVMKVLKDDQVTVLGVHGVAGVGKTTMVKHVGAQAKKDGLFDRVIMVVISKSPDLDGLGPIPGSGATQ
uniref:uncharacterized protein LOC101315437 n=1 Tax=Fragaria vesca subsp. vesca TaxID=101020 RepID=UPI0005CAAD99|nr:PREDICTED: uncharacterized protein LOC101315437 [Fragaria vesca subsp. vesca]